MGKEMMEMGILVQRFELRRMLLNTLPLHPTLLHGSNAMMFNRISIFPTLLVLASIPATSPVPVFNLPNADHRIPIPIPKPSHHTQKPTLTSHYSQPSYMSQNFPHPPPHHSLSSPFLPPSF